MKTLGEASTPAEVRAEAALTAVAAWTGRQIGFTSATLGIASPSHRGVDSEAWLVAVDQPSPAYFLKIVNSDQKAFVDLEAVFEAASIAAGLGCTPTPRHLARDADAIVFDLLPPGWKTARMDDLRRADVMERVIALKKAIHGARPFTLSWTVFDRIRVLDNACQAADVDHPDDLWWMLDGVGEIERAITAAGYDVRPSHADGLASNVMISQDGAVQLVDFDEARNVDPLYEIGILLNEAFPFEEEMRPALEVFEGSFRQASLDRCRAYAAADDLMWGLWGMLMNSTSPRGDIEFLKYAQWRLLRCRMALRHPDFELKLTRL
ncbi:aminoglycoside phosphotransferase family protein [Mesorhizobium sp.]|uniref:aminoglycoside phosphotransferase family protein n=1 Tax=Mesorhizobium sp. TaxID=1871066 RepID=UPI000FE59A80|nr:aminoglycoside phosphotransferase family protein [Mesorhizobium sp.]RWP16802.1 MAG: aminoglycoside phosphotransferase family protein [Mesorhizobium sp.]TIM50765.1 MAG: aminoglycoside phosphotransferase family protein [Mesorhizobium sp.]